MRAYEAWKKFCIHEKIGKPENLTPEKFEKCRQRATFKKVAERLQYLSDDDFDQFFTYLLVTGYKSKQWLQTDVYMRWVGDRVKKETPYQAAIRSLSWMVSYCDETNTPITDLIRNKNRLMWAISLGKVSPYVLFIFPWGEEIINTITPNDTKGMETLLDIGFWRIKAKRDKKKIDEIKEIINESNS